MDLPNFLTLQGRSRRNAMIATMALTRQRLQAAEARRILQESADRAAEPRQAVARGPVS